MPPTRPSMRNVFGPPELGSAQAGASQGGAGESRREGVTDYRTFLLLRWVLFSPVRGEISGRRRLFEPSSVASRGAATPKSRVAWGAATAWSSTHHELQRSRPDRE